MKNLLYKEFKLATPLITFLFLGFSVMAFIPGYPILCGVFFICLGMFQGYQYSREAGDIMYSVLLPVKKTDVVNAKYLAVFVMEMIALVLFTVFTIVRMTFLSDAGVYVNNVMLGANPVFLAFVLLIFAAFNSVFIGGFFKTAYNFGKHFVVFVMICFLIIILAEVAHHIPGFAWMNVLDFSSFGSQLLVLTVSVLIYAVVTLISCRNSQRRFEKIDM